MEISSISGPDYVPTGFSSEPPRAEQAAEEERAREAPPEPAPPEERGSRIDTYA
jgi:hypothetical protein